MVPTSENSAQTIIRSGACSGPDLRRSVGPRVTRNRLMLEDESAPVPAVLRKTFPESKVIAAIPAYNEGTTIGSVVLKARQFASEVVVIDDESTDDTAEAAALAGAHVIRHARNLGKGMAVRSAWLYAREEDAEALVLLGGDYQHEPKGIPRLVDPMRADVVSRLDGGFCRALIRSLWL